jgi:mannonate dehydratase
MIQMEQSMRWYGQNDPVSLSDIMQAGCKGVVSALHWIPIGEVWNSEDIQAYKSRIETHGLTWTVVESLPVHEDIKTRTGKCSFYIDNYKQSIVNLAQCGIKVITYNFMPVLDWLRTDTAYILPNRAQALKFIKIDHAVFDLFLLQRPNAKQDYSKEEFSLAKAKFDDMPLDQCNRLADNILLGLPGSNEDFTMEQVSKLLENYKDVGTRELKENLVHFLREITPVAEEHGIKLAIHPDDPPFSVLGLPRIMSTEKDIQDIMDAVPSVANGLCFCVGSFGSRQDNDLVEMIRKWGSRIYFLHLRNTKRDRKGNFIEASHLGGDADMYALMYEIVKIMQQEKRSIPMRPDHGHKMLDDLSKKTYPGYSAIGRLKGLAELRGLEYAVLRFLHQQEAQS